MDDIRRQFVGEAREITEGLTQGALAVERTGALSPEARKYLLRLAHTLKGAARIVGEGTVAEAAHAIEDVVSGAGETVDRTFGSRILGLIDVVTAALREAAPAPAEAERPAPDESGRTLRIELPAVDALLEQVSEMVDRLTGLRAALERSARDPVAHHQAVTDVDRLGADVGELRASLLELRLTPAQTLFLPLERAARDAALAAGVRVRFEPSGGEQRLDADVLTGMRDALVQLVRNAVAHGIESPSARTAAGKPREGLIALTVERRGAQIAFVCRDDGRGLDVAALRRVLTAGGGPLRAAAGNIDERQLLGLLLEGGLTSRREASHLSGRGVGLHLVRSIVSRLHGRMSLSHQAGRGFTVELLVPVSLRSLECLRLDAGRGRALLPLDAVRRTLRLSGAERVQVEGRPHLVVEGRPIPLVPLETLLEGGDSSRESRDRVAAIVKADAQEVAVSADRFGGTVAALVQPVPALAAAAPVVSGVTADDAGVLVPVLEPSALAAVARAQREPVRPKVPRIRRARLLVVDDSITTRMLEQSILEGAGFQVDAASSAEEALAKAAVVSYDLFIVDVEMPGMDGFEFTARVGGDPALARTPVMLVTSRSSEADRRRGVEVGARAYVVKSEFDQDVFLNTVRGLVG